MSLLPQDRRVVEVMNAQDGLCTVLVRHPDGTHQTRIIGSIVDHLFAPDDPERVLTQLADPAVRIVSLTITEGGYFYDAARDEVQLDAPGLAHDLEDPSHPTTAFGAFSTGSSGGVATESGSVGPQATSRPPASARKVANRTVVRAASCMITLSSERF